MLSRLGLAGCVFGLVGLTIAWAQAPIGASGAGAPTGAAGSVPTAPAMGPAAVGAATPFGAVGPAVPSTPGALSPFVIAPQSNQPGVPNFTGPGTLLSNSTFFAAGTTTGITGTFPSVFGGPVYGAVGAVGFPSPVYIVIEGATVAPPQPPAPPSAPPQGGAIVNAPGMGNFVPAAPTTYARR